MTAADLCAALALLFADVPTDRSCAAAHAIIAASGSWDPALVAAIVINESKATPDSVGTRGEVGSMQVRLYGADRRRRERAARASHLASVVEGVRRLDECAAWCSRRGDSTILCQLAAYRGGPRAARARKYAGARKLLRSAARIRSAAGRHGVDGDRRTWVVPLHEIAPGGTFLTTEAT